MLDFRAAPAEIGFDEAVVDNSGRAAETEEHGIWSAADLDALDVVVVAGNAGDEKITRNVRCGQATHARAWHCTRERGVVVDFVAVRIADDPGIGEVAIDPADLRSKRVDEQALEIGCA